MRDSVDEYEEKKRKEMLQSKRLCNMALMKEKRKNDLYGNFIDPEPPADETEIQFPHYILL